MGIPYWFYLLVAAVALLVGTREVCSATGAEDAAIEGGVDGLVAAVGALAAAIAGAAGKSGYDAYRGRGRADTPYLAEALTAHEEECKRYRREMREELREIRSEMASMRALLERLDERTST